MPPTIRTPDQRLRVFVSSTLQELADERAAARSAIEKLRLRPVMFELGARAHAPRNLYRAYLDQSDIFLAIYWQQYGWIAPGMEISGLEDEYLSAGSKPRLVYVKRPAPERDPRLERMLDGLRSMASVSYKSFSTAAELQDLIEHDLAILLSERFMSSPDLGAAEEIEEHAAAPALPSDPTPLVGREVEVNKLRALIDDDDVRLVTLTGPGGIGKSRLAVEVARGLTDRMEVAFVGLAAISTPDLFVPTVAQAIGVRQEGKDLQAALVDRIGQRPLLLLLDNFEQVLEAAPLVADLLMAAPALKVLITSRSVLRLRGEREFPVPPLASPEEDDLASRGDLLDEPSWAAIRLFVERARDVQRDFDPTPGQLGLIARICRRLDGLPLAIELAAARVRVLSLEALWSRLEDRLGLLVGGKRDLPDRQRTLRDTIDWSYRLLDAGEQALFARLSVFVGGCSLEAAEEVCNPEGVHDVLTGIGSLVEKSLLKEDLAFGGDVRFSMLETIHDFAVARLQERGETTQLLELHAGYFVRIAAKGAEGLRGSHQVRWSRRLDEEQDNLRAALSWAEERDRGLLLRLVASLAAFWVIQGRLAEGIRWTERALAGQSGDPVLRAQVMRRQGEMAWGLGERNRARKVYDECRRLYEELGDEEGVALALRGIGRIALDEGEYERARAIYEESLKRQRKLGLTRGAAETLNNLGLVATLQGDLTRAVSLLEECLELFRELDDQQGIARAALNLSVTLREEGDLDRAAAFGKESLDLWNALGGKWDIADCLEALGAVEVDRGDASDGLILLGAAAELRSEIGVPLAPFDAELLAKIVEKARVQLGDEALSASLGKGKSLPLDEAIALALSGGPASA